MQAEIRADYFQLLFVDAEAGDEDLEEHWTDEAQDLRIAAFPGGFMVATLDDGPVAVDVEAAGEPPGTDPGDWDHVVRAGVELPSGKLAVTGPTGDDAVGVRLEPGPYVVEARFLDFGEPHPRCSVRLWSGGEAPAEPVLVATSGAPVDAADAALRRHLRRSWPGRPMEEFEYGGGPIVESVPGFRVLRLAPDARSTDWVYVSSGAARVAGPDGERFEFAVAAPREDALHVELLAALTHFHVQPDLRLAPGRVIPLGRPWLPDSPADHLALERSWPGLDALPALEAAGGRVELLWARLVEAAEAAELTARS